MSTMLSIDVYSDVICPWCYVGQRRLERALQQLTESVTARVLWRPFQLNPTMPKEGMDRVAYLEAKFGSLDAFRQLEEHVSAAGESEQIAFAFEKIGRTPNTFNAHRLIWYAGQQGCQDAVVQSLFRGYFEEGADIGSAAVLTQLASRAGLSAEPFLAGEAGTGEVREEETAGHRLGIRGVPYFIFAGAYAMSGAQPVSTFVSALRRVAADQPDRKGGV